MKRIPYNVRLTRETIDQIKRVAAVKRWNLNVTIEIAIERLAGEVDKEQSITSVIDSK